MQRSWRRLSVAIVELAAPEHYHTCADVADAFRRHYNRANERHLEIGVTGLCQFARLPYYRCGTKHARLAPLPALGECCGEMALRSRDRMLFP